MEVQDEDLSVHYQEILDVMREYVDDAMAKQGAAVRDVVLTVQGKDMPAPIIHNEVATPDVHVENKVDVPAPVINLPPMVVNYAAPSVDTPGVTVQVDMTPVADALKGLASAIRAQGELFSNALSAISQKVHPRKTTGFKMVVSKNGDKSIVPIE